jgi:hypothetical protein
MDLTLISIVVGLGLTELLLNFHRLVRERRNVSWDPLPLAWALLLLVASITGGASARSWPAPEAGRPAIS